MTATITFEIEIELSGEYTPYTPPTGPSYASGGDPGYGPEVDDLDIDDIGIVALDRTQRSASHPLGVWKTTSLLDGIDRRDPAIQRLFANILNLRREDAEQALIDDHERWAA